MKCVSCNKSAILVLRASIAPDLAAGGSLERKLVAAALNSVLTELFTVAVCEDHASDVAHTLFPKAPLPFPSLGSVVKPGTHDGEGEAFDPELSPQPGCLCRVCSAFRGAPRLAAGALRRGDTVPSCECSLCARINAEALS